MDDEPVAVIDRENLHQLQRLPEQVNLVAGGSGCAARRRVVDLRGGNHRNQGRISEPVAGADHD
ncbi:hypothetical protein OG394_00735 [Kribbella sp. NBC_01245]|uniref:hypothetical protein n=1 Tax=Kribbella sp. NBC_01245 TaxID=2903578 RepID=UPI002E2BB3C6|nr:hypothetical protein [Kribbella sp. NBC_01245]